MTSSANTAPAKGAWKVAAIPAPEPHAASSTTRAVGILSAEAIDEPSAAPTWTIGPSRPAEPPDPMVSAEATSFTTATRPGIAPPLRRTASITSGIPCPFADGAKRAIRGP